MPHRALFRCLCLLALLLCLYQPAEAGTQPPVLEPIGDKAGAEGQLLSFTVVATDPDIEQSVIYAASGQPFGATFDGTTGLFTWTPGYTQAGSYSVNFVALDDGVPMMADSERITITVADMNQPPVLNPIGNKAGKEGTLLQFTISGYDFDPGQTLTFSAANLPGAIFDPATATFSWTPAYGQQGTYVVTFTATDDGVPQASDSEDVNLIIGYANTPPLLAPIGDLVIDEGQELRLQLAANDPDTGQTLTFSAANPPSGATFDPATAEFLWVPDYSQGGYVYTGIIFSVTDNGVPAQHDSETISITVNDVNAPPVLDPVGNRIVIYEGQLLQFQVTASDFDGDNLTFAAGNLPPEASFDSVTQVFTWTPTYDQAGNFRDILFTVTDDGEPPRSDSESIWISVGDVNRPPVLDPIGPLSVDEGELLQVQITGSDLDVEQTLTFSAYDLPSRAAFDSATRLFTWQPAEWQAGNYIVRFKVSDSAVPPESDFEDVTITVGRVNRPPVLDPIGNKGIQESDLLQFVITGTDPDNDGLVFSATNLPQRASFEPMTHAFSWIPQPGQRGNYNVTFTVSDSSNPPLTDGETVTITVGSINRYPVIDRIGYVAVQVGQTLQLTVTGSDPDGDGLTFSASNLPPEAVFNSLTRVLTWTPTAAGNYSSLFEVTDDGEPPLGASTVATLVASKTPVPRIDQLSPVLAAPHQQVTIFGSNFGSRGKIRVGGKLYKPSNKLITSWSDNRIDFQLRAYATWPSGKTVVVDVWVIVGGIRSNQVPLTITVP